MAAMAEYAPGRPNLRLVQAFPGGPMITRATAENPKAITMLRKDFDNTLKTKEELIDFLKTLDIANREQMTKLINTVRFKRVNNIVRILLDNDRKDVLEKQAYIGFDFDELAEDEETPLTYCIKKNDLYTFMKISAKASLDAGTDTSRGNALHRAIAADRFDFVAAFFYALVHNPSRYGPADVWRILNTKRNSLSNMTPVYSAIARKNPNILQLVLAAGGNPNDFFSERLGITFLFYAVQSSTEEIVKVLLSYGADPDFAGPNGLTAADRAKQLGKIGTERILRNAMAKTSVLFTPQYKSPKSPLKYMFSQRGATCAPDAFFTILMEADPIREDFQAALRDDRLLALPLPPLADYSDAEKATASIIEFERFRGRDKTMEVFASVIPRYKKMKSLEKKSLRRTRRNSLNAGEGDATLESIGGCTKTGTMPAKIMRMINIILTENRFGILKKNYHIAASQITTHENPGTIPELEKVFAFKIAYGFPGKTGHVVCMFKREGNWYFGDNQVGLLHRIKDAEFMTEFYKAASKSELMYKLAYVYANENKTSSDTMKGYLVIGDKHYPPDYKGFSTAAYPINEVVMIYQSEPTSDLVAANAGGARRYTRRQKKAN